MDAELKAALDAFRSDLTALATKVENGFAGLFEGVDTLHSSAADTRRAVGSLDEKLVRIQEALYFLAHKKLTDSESEQLRSMLPDPPKRRSSISP